MPIYRSTRTFDGFFTNPRWKNYRQYSTDPMAREVFEWLKGRIDMLLASIVNHRKPALQGVIVDLEAFLCSNSVLPEEKRNFFITMIGSMVCYLVEEFGFGVKRSGVPLRHSSLISTASAYERRP